jgi:feruloyl esterase
MERVSVFSKRIGTLAGSLAVLLMFAGLASRAHAADYLDLPVVKPVVSCDQLAKTDLSQAVGAKVTVKAAEVTDTPKGKYCKVTGTIEPSIGFEADLPMEHWTQRYTQGGCGGYCGSIRLGIGVSGSCVPALNGDLAVATDDLGHQGDRNAPNPQPEGSFAADPQKRIDFAYRANHETALVSKALIKAFYGQPQKFAYFVGCSDGGREALQEAERFPEDFDGISAGAPVAIITVHNSFFHAWEISEDKRADGSNILLRGRLNILHDAVMAHCAAVSGVDNGVLQEPRACKFDPAWVQCPADAADTSRCLTAEEVGVAQKIYEGPYDAAGHHFEIGGYPLGSELQWGMPANATGAAEGPGGGMVGGSLKYMLLPTVSDETAEALTAKFAYTEDWFQKVGEMAHLYNAANTDLRPFEKHGGKLIVWHGGSDTSVPPAISIAFYQGVQKELGEKTTDSFMRLFILPGVGHCGNGDGPAQLDVLTPLMAWAELKQAPKMLLAGKTVNENFGPPPAAPGPQSPVGPGATGAQKQMQDRPQQQPGNPYSSPAKPAFYTRPIYPFPYLAQYTGKGDPKDAANYEPVKSPVAMPQVFDTEAAKLIGPDNQKFYHAENGQLVEDKKK